MTLNEAKDLKWGTYGLHPSGDAKKPGPGPLRWTTLGKCATSHLRNILKTQHQITEEYRTAINLILADRGAA